MFQHKIIVNLISGHPPFSDRAFYKTLPLAKLLGNCVPLVPCPYCKPIWILCYEQLVLSTAWPLFGQKLMEVLGTSPLFAQKANLGQEHPSWILRLYCASQFTPTAFDPISMTCGPDWWIWTSWSLCWIAKVWFRLGPRIRSEKDADRDDEQEDNDGWWWLMMTDDVVLIAVVAAVDNVDELICNIYR